MPKINVKRMRVRGNKDRTWKGIPGFGEGVYPIAATDAMTQPVGRDAQGRLFTEPTGGGGSGGIKRLTITKNSGGQYILTIVTTDGMTHTAQLPEHLVNMADSAPTETTIGSEGELRFDTTSSVLYICEGQYQSMGAAIYKWTPVGGADGLPEITEADTGRVLRIVNDTAVWTDMTDVESVVNRSRSAQPMVTFVDDDGRAAVWDKLKPLSEQYGIPFVVAMVTDRIGTTNNLSAEQLVSLQGMGWEIASHTMGHTMLDEVTEEEQEAQLRGSKEALEAIGIKCDTICYPYSRTTDDLYKLVRKYYRAGRQTHYQEWINESPLETWDLRTVSIGAEPLDSTESGLASNSLEYYKLKVDEAVAKNAWVIFLTHCSESTHDDAQQTYLAQTVEYVQSLGVPVVTIREALDRRGNIVDTGRYTRQNPGQEHYVVGCDSTRSMSGEDKHVIQLETNAITNSTPPSAFRRGAITTCRINSENTDAGGFPWYSMKTSGFVVTNTMGEETTPPSAPFHKWCWQEFYVMDYAAPYRRWALSESEWSAWSFGEEVLLTEGSVDGNSVLSDFPVGVKSRVRITSSAAANGIPGNSGGYLITDRTDIDRRWIYQMYVPGYWSSSVGWFYYRVWNSAGSKWTDWISIGERAATTALRDKATTPKTVGASVFDTDLGKPVWWNGTAWVESDPDKLDKSGGTLSGKIVLPTGNENAGFVNSGDVKIFGYGNIDSVSHLRVGDATRPLQLRGSAERPKYNDDEMVLKTEFDSALGSYITDIDALVGGEE